jgi:PAS domain S-box-containing protein
MVSPSVYQSLCETSLSAFFLTTIKGTILKTNKAACDMFGYTESELKESGWQGILETTDQLFAQMMIQRKKEGAIQGVLIGIRKNGARFPISFSSVIIKNEDGGEIAGIIANDISEQKQQEEELKRLLEETKRVHQQGEESRAMLSNVLDSITDGFFIVDSNWTILFWNKAASQILRKKEQEVRGKIFGRNFPNWRH